jgi:hypothetical protein
MNILLSISWMSYILLQPTGLTQFKHKWHVFRIHGLNQLHWLMFIMVFFILRKWLFLTISSRSILLFIFIWFENIMLPSNTEHMQRFMTSMQCLHTTHEVNALRASHDYFLSKCCCLVPVGRPLWREDGSATCSVITQWSESHRTCNHTLLSHLRLPQPGGPGSRIYIPQEQGGPVIPPGTGYPLRRLLRLTGLQ